MKKLNKKGFTLIELLAVIVILGIIMLIAIPSVSTIIENSRKNTFVSSAQTLISGARNMALSDPTGKPTGSPWIEVDVSKIDSEKLAATNNFSADKYTSKGWAIKTESIKVESGSVTKSSFGANYNSSYSYVLALENKDDSSIDYYIQLYDTDKHAIKLVNETALDQENLVNFGVGTGSILSIDDIKPTPTPGT